MMILCYCFSSERNVSEERIWGGQDVIEHKIMQNEFDGGFR